MLLLPGALSVENKVAVGADSNNNNKEVVFKNFTSFTDSIKDINIILIDNDKDIVN